MSLTEKYKASPFAHLVKSQASGDNASIFVDKNDYAKKIKVGRDEITGTATYKFYPDGKSVVGPWRLRPPSGGQPYLEIFPYDSPNVKRINSQGNAMIPGGAIAEDIARITMFLKSGPGVQFLATRTAMQLMNPTIETKLFNPASMFGQYARIWGAWIPGASKAAKGHLGTPPLAGPSRYFNDEDPLDSVISRTKNNARIQYQVDGNFLKLNPNRYKWPVDSNLKLTTIELASKTLEFVFGLKYAAATKIVDPRSYTWNLQKSTPSFSQSQSTGLGILDTFANLLALFTVQNKFTYSSKYSSMVDSQSINNSSLAGLSNKILNKMLDKTKPIAGQPLSPNADLNTDKLEDSFTFTKVEKVSSSDFLPQANSNAYVKNYGMIPNRDSSDVKYSPPNGDSLRQNNDKKMSVTGVYPGAYDKVIDKKRAGFKNIVTEQQDLVDSGKDLHLDNDYIKFAFTSISLAKNQTAVFRATLRGLTDTVTPTWNADEFVGRADMAYTYKNFERTLAFDFDIAIGHPFDLKPTYNKINFLYGLCYPAQYQATNIGMFSPLLKLTIGDLYKNVLGFLETFAVTVDDNATWEIEEGFQVPKLISINIGFKTIWSSTATAPVSTGRHVAYGKMEL